VLMLKRISDVSGDRYIVLHRELQLGQISKRKVALRPDTQWLWIINGVPVGPAGLEFTGLAPTFDEAMVALKARWFNGWNRPGCQKRTARPLDFDMYRRSVLGPPALLGQGAGGAAEY
jgi:hypothetical protein